MITTTTMKHLLLFSFLFSSLLLGAQTRYDVSSGTEFKVAQQQANAGDTIVWAQGTYSDTRMEINTDGIIVTARPYGTVLFTGASRVVIHADHVTFSGFQYVGGAIGTLEVCSVYGSDVLITHVNIQNYTSHKYLRVYKESRRTTISYCNFENRLNLVDQNILSILVDDEPGYHKIQYCSFKNFDGIGKDEGIEPIRIGVSTQGHLDSRTLVEYCYFTQCNGDGEIISHKSRQNVYRYNTFENNPVAELVLRHGDEGIIYGNFFLNNLGGVRVREGSDHFIFNNYFEGLHRRAIFLMNDPADPLSNIHIYHNTIIDSEEVILGGNGNDPPTNVILANNVFANPRDVLFVAESTSETWTNNLSFGDLGINVPTTGMTEINPDLVENSEGYVQPAANSPLLAGASDDYPAVPLYPGMEFDNELVFDLMQQERPLSIADRAVGASEFSSTVNVQPYAIEMNTGPSYLFDNPVDYVASNTRQVYIGEEGDSRSVFVSSNIDWTVIDTIDWISTDLSTGSGDAQFNIIIDPNIESLSRSGTLTIVGRTQSVSIDVFQDADETVSVLENLEHELSLFPNPTDGKIELNHLPSGSYSSFVELIDTAGRSVLLKEYRIVNQKLVIDLDALVPGSYLLNMKIISQNGTVETRLSRKIIRY